MTNPPDLKTTKQMRRALKLDIRFGFLKELEVEIKKELKELKRNSRIREMLGNFR